MRKDYIIWDLQNIAKTLNTCSPKPAIVITHLESAVKALKEIDIIPQSKINVGLDVGDRVSYPARHRKGKIIELDNDNSRARVRWDVLGTHTWVRFSALIKITA